ncbi:MAG TPA: LuxR C-terminal-related transcriptional regulator [Candidatus Dormibacteraeota bacterium]|nr:LuxR C-terminal-related transcriptional regulator [Candidatus Dormibacteraeota bacterium]
MDLLTEEELLSQLSDRLGLLKAASRTAPERQQTMVATIDWSYRLLTEDEALLFRRLSVFRGGFTLESAQAVCGDGIDGNVLEALAGLVRKSMVVAERGGGGHSRYRLLESHFRYTEDRLRETGELELVRRRHYEYFQGSLAARTFWPQAPSQPSGLPDFATEESANLWAALGWARHNAEDLGLSLVVDFGPKDFTQARSLLGDVLSHSPARGTVRVSALCRATLFAFAQGDGGAALQAAEEAVAIARELGSVDSLAWALNCLGQAQRHRGELAAAAEVFEEASSLLEESTNRRLLCVVRCSIALIAIETGDYPGGSALLTDCVATARAEGDVFWLPIYLDSLARAQLGMKDHKAAIISFKEAVSANRRINDFAGIVNGISGLSCVAADAGADDRALRLAAAADHMSDEWSVHSDPWLQDQAELAGRRSRSRLGARKSEEAWKEGSALSADQAIEYALGEGEPQSRVDAGPLSARELEVVKLVAAGMTNRQIAARLFVAERTVDNHLEHVREKLAVKTRAQIAAWVAQRGLAPGPANVHSETPPPGRS